MFPVHEMMSLHTNPMLATVLTRVPIAHQTGDAQILIQSGWVLILAPRERGRVEPCNIDLHILNHDGTDWEGNVLDHPDHFLHIGFDGGRQSSTALAGSTILPACRAIPPSCPTALATLSTIL